MARLTTGEDVLTAGFGSALVTIAALPFTRRGRDFLREWRAQRIYDHGAQEIPGVRPIVIPSRERTAALEREMKGVKTRLSAVETTTNDTNVLVRQLIGGDGNGNSLAAVIERLAKLNGVWVEGATPHNRRENDAKDD